MHKNMTKENLLLLRYMYVNAGLLAETLDQVEGVGQGQDLVGWRCHAAGCPRRCHPLPASHVLEGPGRCAG